MPEAEIEAAFPQLNHLNYHITSDETPFYNCAAWAAEVVSIPWWPIEGGGYYWPPTARCEPSIAAFVAAYGSIGYEVCADAVLEAGHEKIAIYAKNGLPEHVARQLESGRWTSKLGEYEDISHLSHVLLQGDTYGYVAVFMRRLSP